MDEILTAGEVAELLQIHPRTVYKLVKDGSIPGRKFGGGWRFSRSEIVAMVSTAGKYSHRPVKCTPKSDSHSPNEAKSLVVGIRIARQSCGEPRSFGRAVEVN
jgi:excisionase family DNA binding protein